MPAIAAYQSDVDGLDPAHGDTWGPKAGSWYLHKNYLGFQVIGDGGNGLCNVIAQPVKDIIGDLDYTWTTTKTSAYTAAVGEAVVCDVSGGGFTVTLPPWSASPENGRILISTIAYVAGVGKFASVAPDGSDLINGISQVSKMADSGINTTTDINIGGDWRFIRSANASVGWSCSRYLKPPPPV